MFGRVPRRERCPYVDCKNRGTPTMFGPDFCPQHVTERDETAIAAWVDPATLRREPWVNDGGETPIPCGACGHPRWAHVVPGVWDGRCVVTGCDACDGAPGHAPGYVPSSPLVA